MARREAPAAGPHEGCAEFADDRDYAHKRSMTSVEKYGPPWGDEIIDSFDLGDWLYSEDYDAVGKVVDTTDYDGDVDDDTGREIFIEARVKLRFPDEAPDGKPWEDWLNISQVWRTKEEAMNA